MKQIGTEQIANGAIANSVTTCRIFDQNRVHIDRGSFLQKYSLTLVGQNNIEGLD